eukprot:CAMPEP_0180443564 /NCGR_PEP_ID=MMETSP1036_2-20121128/14741_1 /TAXON_ID=632150 /ORGANISM="Azadinium spinosum, Strain 3D9" /LENGTH=141 /DNA_ID=CAMNT_0022449883 /DNA_START=210 /DNA_END=635 /DNA_ORIENTATION=+
MDLSKGETMQAFWEGLWHDVVVDEWRYNDALREGEYKVFWPDFNYYYCYLHARDLRDKEVLRKTDASSTRLDEAKLSRISRASVGTQLQVLETVLRSDGARKYVATLGEIDQGLGPDVTKVQYSDLRVFAEDDVADSHFIF